MSIKIENNAWGRLAASIADTDTTITLIDASLFPVIAVDDYFFATLINTSNELEIVKVTAVVGNDLTVERGAEGTTSRGYSQNDLIEQRVTAQTVYDLFTENSQDAAAAQAAAEQAASDAQQVVDDFETDYGSLTAAITAAQGYADDANSSATDAQNAQTGAEQSETDAQAAQAAAEAAQAAAEAAAASAVGGSQSRNHILEPEFVVTSGRELTAVNTIVNDLDWLSPTWQLMHLEDGGTVNGYPLVASFERFGLQTIEDGDVPTDFGPREDGGFYGLKSNITMVGGGGHSYLKLSGKMPQPESLVNDSNNVTISFWAKGSIAGDIGVAIKKYYGRRYTQNVGKVIAEIESTGTGFVPWAPNPIVRPSICAGNIRDDLNPFFDRPGVFFIDGANKILVGLVSTGLIDPDPHNDHGQWEYDAFGASPFRNIGLGDYPVIDLFSWAAPGPVPVQYIAYADELGSLQCISVDEFPTFPAPRFTQISPSQTVPNAGKPAIAASDGNVSQGEQGIFYYDDGNQELRFYEWVESIYPTGSFVLRGSIAVPGGGRGSLTRVGRFSLGLPVVGGRQYIAFIDSSNQELRMYYYEHTTDTFTLYGTPLSIPGIGIPSIADEQGFYPLTNPRIAFLDSVNGELRTYEFDVTSLTWSLKDSFWIKPGIGEVSVCTLPRPRVAHPTENPTIIEPYIAFVDDQTQQLRTFTREYKLDDFPGGGANTSSPWFNHYQQSRVEYEVQNTVSLTTDWQKFTVSGVYTWDVRLEYDHSMRRYWYNEVDRLSQDTGNKPPSLHIYETHAALEIFINNGADNLVVNGLGPIDYQGELYITNVQVNPGSVPIKYIHKDPFSPSQVEELSQYYQYLVPLTDPQNITFYAQTGFNLDVIGIAAYNLPHGFRYSNAAPPIIVNPILNATGGRRLGNSNTPAGAQTGTVRLATSISEGRGHRLRRTMSLILETATGTELVAGGYYTYRINNASGIAAIDTRIRTLDTDN